MNVIQAFILGLVQGVTEFLPISSSGHLLLLQKIFGLNGNFLFFNLFLHLATLICVAVVFRSQIVDLIKHPFSKKAKMLYLSCVPTIILAFVFRKTLNNISGVFLGTCFILTALALLVSQVVAKKKKSLFPIDYKTSFLMGVIQGIAVFPGISRSGSTLSIGLLCGADRKDVAEFSFLMSVPVIIGGFLVELIDLIKLKQSLAINPLSLIIGFTSALIFGFISLKTMVNLVKKLKLSFFSIYLFIISIITFIFVH